MTESKSQSGGQPQDLARTRARILHHHFFRRFFDNDTVSFEAEMEVSVVRALCFCAVPSLMVAFWLLPCYPNRPELATVADRYFFVLNSFVAMGVVTTFEWEMLFPDRADFQILLPLPLQARELFFAKGRALLSFLGMFLVASNIFATVLFPAVSTGSQGNFFSNVSVHFVSVMLSGIFAAFAMLAIEGISLCILPGRSLRLISPVLQAFSITLLLLLLLLFPLFGSHMQTLLEGHAAFAKFIPPLWFLGLYEHLLLGNSAPAGAQELANIGLYATASVTLLAFIAYPVAWARQEKRAIEGASQARVQSRGLVFGWLHTTLLRRPQERAVFHFISQTMQRNTRYQVYLAIYSGVGIALALASIVTLRFSPDRHLHLALSDLGLHAVLPLLLFWLVLGLKSAFAFPVDMLARWVFPMNLLQTGAHRRAANTWVLICCSFLTCAVLVFLCALGWNTRALTLQAIWGICLSFFLADVFFVHTSRIPFTQPRLPGRATLPITLTLYAAAFPAFVLLSVHLEILAESHWAVLIRVVLCILGLHLLLELVGKSAKHTELSGFSLEETDDSFQTLGLNSYY